MVEFVNYTSLRKRKEFLRVQSSGRRFRRRSLVLLIHQNELTIPRVGFTVSKRVGNAVTRNRVRRRLREIVRAHSDNLCSGMDYVIIALPRTAHTEFAVLCRDLTSLICEAQDLVSRSASWSHWFGFIVIPFLILSAVDAGFTPLALDTVSMRCTPMVHSKERYYPFAELGAVIPGTLADSILSPVAVGRKKTILRLPWVNNNAFL